MRGDRQSSTPSQQLWRRILERYRSGRGWCRPRIPLVLRRCVLPSSTTKASRPAGPSVSHYRFALHVHLSLLWWRLAHTAQASLQGATRYLSAAPQEANRPLTVLQHVVNHAVRSGRFLVTTGDGTSRARAGHRLRLRRPGGVPPDMSSIRRREAVATRSAPALAVPTASANTTTTSSSPVQTPARTAAVPMPAANVAPLPPATLGMRPRHVSSRRFRHLRSDAAIGSGPVAAGRIRRGPSQWHETVRRRHDAPFHSPPRASSTPRPGGEPSLFLAGSRSIRSRTTETVNRSVTVSSRALSTGAMGVPVTASLRPALTVAAQSSHRELEDRRHRPSVVGETRSRLYAQPAVRSFAVHPAVDTPKPATVTAEQRPVPPPPVAAAVQPQIDLARLTEDVYHHIQRKIRIERERRGL